MVEIEVNGLNEVLACRIEPALFEQQDRELIEDLVRGGHEPGHGQKPATARRGHEVAGRRLRLPGLKRPWPS